MMTRTEPDGNEGAGSSNSGRLLRDIEEISRALYLHKPPPKALISPSDVRSKPAGETPILELKTRQNPRILYESETQKEKKTSSSLWNWKKSLKALAHIGHHRFNICFFLHVHSIEGLPVSFNSLSLCVRWKRKEEVSRTSASRVLDGFAEFEETLMHKCTLYGSRTGPHNSAKYEAKLFQIYASIVGAPGIDIGKHWVDLTRLLPLTLEELEGEKSSVKWTTSFKLAGKAKGATLNVSFGFFVTGDNSSESIGNINVPNHAYITEDGASTVKNDGGFCQSNGNSLLQRLGSVPIPINSNNGSPLSSVSVDLKLGHEVLPSLGLELSKSISFLYQKLNEGDLYSSSGLKRLSGYMEPLKPKSDCNFESNTGTNECESTEFFVVEQGIEICQKEQPELEENAFHTIDGSAIEIIDVDEILKDCDTDIDEEAKPRSNMDHLNSCMKEVMLDDCKEESHVYTKPSTVKEPESAFNNLLISELPELESPLTLDDSLAKEKYVEVKSNYKTNKVSKKSLSLDDVAESVETDFLKMLGIEHGSFGFGTDSVPESPRERLLRQFENETLAYGDFLLGFDAEDEKPELSSSNTLCHGDFCEDFHFCLDIQSTEEHKTESTSLKDRRKVKVLENLETEALMREWGLDENTFQNSPQVCSDGFGSPIELPEEEQFELPSLGDGLGHLLWIKSGGNLRSMNPFLFRNCKNVGNLIMQVSRPVVFPARLGTDMELLQNLASLGIENLSLHVNTLMPLDDITGKTMQQVAQEAATGALLPERQVQLQHEQIFDQYTYFQKKDVEGLQFGCSKLNPGYVSPESLAPVAMNTIEILAMEGLRIQSGMSDEDAPSSIRPLYTGQMPIIAGADSSFGEFLSLEGPSGLQFLDVTDNVNSVNRLMGLSISLDEWLKLDAGIIGDEDQISEHAVEILAAHHAKYVDCISGTLRMHANWGEMHDIKHGLLGHNITVALTVLLRDPLRNYEPVGTPMLALLQVEKSCYTAEHEIRSNVVESDQEGNLESVTKDKKEEKGTPLFKITEVHLAGLNIDHSKQQHWGTKTQHQSGIRWLLASGMSKSNKPPLSKSNAIVRMYPPLTRKVRARDVLWSVSSNVHEAGSNTKELAALLPHIRNPDIAIPTDNIDL